MKKLKNFGLLIALGFCFMAITSFNTPAKTHLIVGQWQISGEQLVKLGKNKGFIYTIYFGSDEVNTTIDFKNKKGESNDAKLNLAFNVFEEWEGFNSPLIYFIDTCDPDFKLTFSIERLTKSSLELKIVDQYSNNGILNSTEILKFERIAGPPENMD